MALTTAFIKLESSASEIGSAASPAPGKTKAKSGIKRKRNVLNASIKALVLCLMLILRVMFVSSDSKQLYPYSAVFVLLLQD